MRDAALVDTVRSYTTHDAVRGAVRDTLAAIDATPDISGTELCERLATHRNRPIEIISRPFPCATLTGFWVKTTTADLIVHPDDLSATQRDHSIRHEASHIVFDHAGQTSPEHTEMLRTLLPTLDPDDVVTYLPRTGHYVGAEWEAETFAHILTEAALTRPDRRGRGFFEAGLDGRYRSI